MRLVFVPMAGLLALHGSEPGQVRKEAAKAILCKCRGSGSPPPLFFAKHENDNALKKDKTRLGWYFLWFFYPYCYCFCPYFFKGHGFPATVVPKPSKI